MRILVDADACPVKDIIIEIAKKFNVEVYMYFDLSHEYENKEVNVVFCDKGRDSVDLKIISQCQKDDVVITQDYGLASLALLKKAKVVHINGFTINEENIETLLTSRYNSLKQRKSGIFKGPKKRNENDDEKFYVALLELMR